LIHRDDAAGAIWAALAAPAEMPGGTYNVADDGPVAKQDMAAWLAAQLGLSAPEFDPALPSRRRRAVPDRVIVNARLKRELGWRPRFGDYRAGYADILGAL
ncbi:MAG: epimerase, partial [Cephaloticoccus sp.]